MALLKHSNQRFFKLSDENHSRSKAQMSLKKIIEVISIGHSVESCTLKQKLESGMKVKDCIQRGIGIDLNLRLGPTTESEIQKTGLSACSAVGEEGGDERGGCAGICSSTVVVVVVGGGEFDKSSEGECDPKQVTDQKRRGGEKEGGDEEDARELSSEITEIGKKPIGMGMGEENKEVESEEKREENQEQKAATKVEEEPKKLLSTETKNDGNYLSLLVEAAKLVSGGFEDEEDKTEEQQEEEKSKGKRVRINDDEEEEEEDKAKKSRGKKEDRELEKEIELNYEAFEDISPVVRSKRGRNQVLPHRYRDSVLEPWKRLSSRVSAKPRNNK